MSVPLRRRGLGGVAWHRVRAWRHHDGRVGMAYRDLGVDILAVVGAVAGDGCHCPIAPVEQGPELEAVVSILAGLYPSEAYVTLAGQQRKAMANQIATASKQRLHERIGRLSREDMAAVEQAIYLQLGL